LPLFGDNESEQGQPKRAQKDSLQAETKHRPHQPAQVITRRAQHRMERVAERTFSQQRFIR